MTKLYQKDPLFFALACICVYVCTFSASEGVSARPGAAKYVFRSDLARRNYQLEAAAWKMSVTILSTIWGISSPSTSVSSFVES